MAAKHVGEFLYPVKLMYFVEKLRVIGQTNLGMVYAGERPIPNGAEVKVKKSVSFFSWGEEITVTLTGQSNGTHIRIHSECALPTQIVDWGENEKNVTALFRYFEDRMPGRPISG